MVKRMVKNVSIIIPNYKGIDLLRQNLPALVKNALSAEIIIVDDGSGDDSVLFIQKEYPSIKVISLTANHGFSFAINAGVKEAKGEIVYIMNSDVEVYQGFLESLISHFDKDDVFAVSSIESGGPSGEAVIPFVKFKFGIFWYWYQGIGFKPPSAIEVFCVSGGHTAYDKAKFLQLGGFDPMFRPFYAEDGDVCWRAWKRGWRTLIEPKSLVRHERKKTIGKFYKDAEILAIHWKNRFLLTWKIISSKWLFFKHIVLLPIELIVLPFCGKAEFLRGFLMAAGQLPELCASRKKAVIKNEKYSDGQLFKRFSRRPKFPPFNILYIHETSCFGGAENSLLNLAENLDKNIFKPFYVLPREGIFAKKLRALGAEVYFIEMPRISRFKGVKRAIVSLRGLVRRKKIDLIHTNSIRTNVYGAIAAKSENTPVIWHQRNLITTEKIDPDALLSFLPEMIICNSRAIARRFSRFSELPRKVKVIYNGVNLERFNPGVNCDRIRKEFNLEKKTAVIGIASRFSKNKGHEYFLREACAIKKTFDENRNLFQKKDIKFLVIGGSVFKEDEYREGYIRRLSERLGLKDSVIFCGFRDDMPELFNILDMLVLCSRAEPCGRVLFEAMASGKPVVATDTGGTPEIVLDGVAGKLFRPFERGAMTDAVIDLLKDEKTAMEMGTAGRRMAEQNFSIKKNTEEIEKTYMEILRSKNYQAAV